VGFLDEQDKHNVIAAYQDRLAEHGIDVATLKSGGAAKQYIRHSVHSSLFDLAGKRVLDVGCGIGMFYEFLRGKNIPIASYTGLDIVEPFIAANRERFPEARFEMVDIFQDPLDDFQTDVVFMSQVFNNKYENADNEVIAKEAMRRFFDLAQDGLAIDFMTSYVDYTEDELHYFPPELMLGYAKSLTRLVTLRHDYLPFEFTLALYKQPTYDLDAVSALLQTDG